MTLYPIFFRAGQEGATREYPCRIDYTITIFIDGVVLRTIEAFAFFINEGHGDAMIANWNAMGSKPSFVGRRTYHYARVGASPSIERQLRDALAGVITEFGHRAANDGRMLPAERQPTTDRRSDGTSRHALMIVVRDSRTRRLIGLYWTSLENIRRQLGERECDYARVDCEAGFQFVETHRVNELPTYARFELSDELLALDFRASTWLPLQPENLELAA